MKRSIHNTIIIKVACLTLGIFSLASVVQAAYPPLRETKKAGVPAKDKMFMMETAKGGMAEVMAGKLAAQKGNSAQVKQFGQKMVDDHSKANEELKSLAKSKGVALPSDIGKHKAMIDKLSKLSGAAFDKFYVMEMLNDHKTDVAAFRKEAKTGQDPEVKSWAGQTLPTLEEHLRMITDIHKGMSGK
jgi:putative membrane protein